MFYPGSAGF